MQLQRVRKIENDGNLIFMPGLFHEVMDIILESYEYFEAHDATDSSRIPPFLQAIYSNEMSRITMRLTSVMAWLMARKAVSSGQLTMDEALTDYRLEGDGYCLHHDHSVSNILPYYMNDLLMRSHAIYLRVWRLDQQSSGQVAHLVN